MGNNKLTLSLRREDTKRLSRFIAREGLCSLKSIYCFNYIFYGFGVI